jgi:mRNA-degrading endonuclease toxin of MazEF toxin-antitoxin module
MNRGDVVEVDWPFTDFTGSKRRPAVVVRADFLDGLIDDTVLVKIQSRSYGIPGTEVALDPAVETAAGLSKPCYASCYSVMTRDEGLVGPVIGRLSSAAMQRIEACLKVTLGIR